VNYQSGTTAAAGVSVSAAGIAVLPATGESSILSFVAIGAIVTGVTLVLLQATVYIYRLLNR
jgi:LPXTG-motif cell wall-anchored protein